MPSVVIDGVEYAPVGGGSRIGVGITTHNRYDVFVKTLDAVQRHTPGAKIVVVDDASREPVQDATYRFEKNVGIARAKNKCLELLDDCEHIFLFDDDCYPIVDGWYRPYVDSPEPHLMYQFADLTTAHKLGDMKRLYADDHHVAYSGARGCMTYVHRPVLDIAGGFDPAFGVWGYEHPDWSNRIHAFGLTTWRYADVQGSDKLIYSMDEHDKVKRSVDERVRSQHLTPNMERHNAQAHSAIRYEYREQRDVVLTTLFTSKVDPQRGSRMKANTGLLSALTTSVKKQGHHTVVLHDELTADDSADVTYVQRTPDAQPYFQRWISAYQWLRDNPDVRFIWCVDGTDVEMLSDPFPHMEAGKLYLGSEPNVVGCKWMLDNHKAAKLQDFMKAYADRTLLNAGLVGGDRETVMGFLHRLVRLYHDNISLRFLKLESETLGVGDMAALNYIAYTEYADVIVSGPRVHTVFKAEERNGISWWKHK